MVQHVIEIRLKIAEENKGGSSKMGIIPVGEGSEACGGWERTGVLGL